MFIVTEYAALKRGCTGSSESTLVKMPHCWKSHAAAQLCYFIDNSNSHAIPWTHLAFFHLRLKFTSSECFVLFTDFKGKSM